MDGIGAGQSAQSLAALRSSVHPGNCGKQHWVTTPEFGAESAPRAEPHRPRGLYNGKNKKKSKNCKRKNVREFRYTFAMLCEKNTQSFITPPTVQPLWLPPFRLHGK
jgi:hypothetical protein